MLRNYFTEQINAYQPITEDIFENIEYKRVWSGKMISIGDKVLYAFAIPNGETDIKLFQVLERELNELDKVFIFERFEKETIPVLRFK